MPATVWLRTPFDVLMREWDGEVVCYHTGSAETVLLDEPSAWVYGQLGDTPVSVVVLAEKMVTHYSAEPELASAFVEAALVRLASLGMATRQRE